MTHSHAHGDVTSVATRVLRELRLPQLEKKLSNLRQPQLGKNLKNCKKFRDAAAATRKKWEKLMRKK